MASFDSYLQPTTLETGQIGRVIIHNQTAQDQTYKLTWSYDPSALDVVPPGEILIAPPQSQVTTRFRVKRLAPQRWRGQPRQYELTAQITPQTGEPQTHPLTVIDRPARWPWLVGAALVLLLLALGGGLFWWMNSQPPPPPPPPTATATPSPIPASPTPAADLAVTATVAWLSADDDQDELTNGEELELGTDPQAIDTDLDGLSDAAELRQWETDPLLADTDGDGRLDGEEISRNTDPRQADPVPTATPTIDLLFPPTATPTETATPETPPPTDTPASTAAGPVTPAPPTPTPAPPTATPISLFGLELVDQIGEREVIDVALNPLNPTEVYALAKGVAIYKSSAGGDGPWARLPLRATGLTSLTLDPANPARLYAPTWNGVLRTDDGGQSWQPLSGGLSTANQAVELVVIDPFNGERLYGALGQTLIVSTDAGHNWTAEGYGQGLGGGRLTRVLVSPTTPDLLYVGGFFGSIYRSTDGGRNFTQLAYSVEQGTFGLASHPGRAGVYLAGINAATAGIIKTENGLDFEPASEGLIFGGADSAYSGLAFAPNNPQIVYTGSGYQNDNWAKGIFKSSDGGQSWTKISNGLKINDATGQPHYVKVIVVHPTDPNIALAASGSGLYKTIDGGASWGAR